MDKNEAIEVIKRNYPHVTESGSQFETALRLLIPELKESEGERTWIINYLSNRILNSTIIAEKENLKKAVAWLEKQGEQKPVPKFKVGDTMRTLQEATDGYTDGMPVVVSIDEDYYHCNNELIAIKDQDDYEYPPMNRRQKPADLPKGEDYGIDSLYHAARILEKTLGEVDGYESDDGILEHKCAIEAVNRLYKQKPAWSEEDEKMLNMVIKSCEQCGNEYAYYWLKSLKERYTWKPSDEQMLALDSAIHCYAGISPTNNREVYALEIMKEQLKKLRWE